MKHLFVPYEIARQLKEKGFNEPCFLVYHDKKLVAIKDHVSSNFLIPITTNKELGVKTFCAPLYQQVINWFRDTHKIYMSIFPDYNSKDDYKTCWGFNIVQLEWGEDKEHHLASYDREYETLYNEALTKAIEAALKLIA